MGIFDNEIEIIEFFRTARKNEVLLLPEKDKIAEKIWYRTSHQRNARQPENHDTSRTGRSTCADYGRVRQLHLSLFNSPSLP